MLNSANCPHLVLGMRGSKPTAEAGMHFALASRRLKNDPDPPFSIEDLTAALSSVESGGDLDHLWFQLPCDDGVVPEVIPAQIQGVSVATEADVLQAINDETLAAGSEDLAAALMHHSFGALMEWRFNDSLVLATSVLRISHEERTRDEALNLIACCQSMLGDDEKALAALEHAVEGEWNLGLQTNLAIVATSHKPERAAIQMRFLIDNAPDSESRLRAATRGISLWRVAQEEITGSEDSEDHDPPPAELLESIRELLSDPGLTEEQFFTLGMFLAETEPGSLASSSAFNSSPFRNKASGRILSYRSEGFGPYINNLVRETKRAQRDSDGAPAFLVERVENIVLQANSLLGDKESSELGVGVGFDLLEQGLDASTPQRIILRGLVALRAASALIDQGDVPARKFITWVMEGKEAIPEVSTDAGPELSEFLTSVVSNAGNMLAAVYHDQFVDLTRQTAQLLAAISHRTGGVVRRLTANRQAIGEAARSLRSTVSEALHDIDALFKISDDEELRNGLRELSRVLNEFYTAAGKWS